MNACNRNTMTVVVTYMHQWKQFGSRLFLLEGGGSLATMKHINVQRSLVASSPDKVLKFSFFEVDFNAI